MLRQVQHDKDANKRYNHLMRLTRLYIPDTDLSTGRLIQLDDDQSHYLLRVLRQEQGNEVILFNAEFGSWQGALALNGKRASVELEKQIQKPQPVSDIWLLASPIKKEAWDFVIEKSVELGVAAFQPVQMEFTQNTRINEDRIRANFIEASRQCERTHIPELYPMQKLETLLKKWDSKRILYVALERGDAKPALDVFDKSQPGAILVGPEGGFSTREKELFLKYDFIKPISLGDLILRVETASLASLALWSAK